MVKRTRKQTSLVAGRGRQTRTTLLGGSAEEEADATPLSCIDRSAALEGKGVSVSTIAAKFVANQAIESKELLNFNDYIDQFVAEGQGLDLDAFDTNFKEASFRVGNEQYYPVSGGRGIFGGLVGGEDGCETGWNIVAGIAIGAVIGGIVARHVYKQS